MELIVEAVRTQPQSRVELVERKGLGHPDTLCDAMAERISISLCLAYRERFGVILHHNVDKILLCGGSARPAFGAGLVTEPIEIYVAGRVTREFRGVSIPVEEIAIEACREILRETLPELDVVRDVRVYPRLRPGSGDLASLFLRPGEVPFANDTSCGTGFAPLTMLERIVLSVEQRLNAVDTKRKHPELGADIKVMGIRIADRVSLTVACAFIGRHLTDLDDYARKKKTVHDLVDAAAREVTTELAIEPTINAADDLDRGEIFLTVSGTSAEAGDDGEVGRGNRANGLITPYRWMTLEAPAGKNPVSHVGKLYSVLAVRIAKRLASEVTDTSGATCLLASRIGRPIDDPELAHVRVSVEAPERFAREEVDDIVRSELADTITLRERLLAGRFDLF